MGILGQVPVMCVEASLLLIGENVYVFSGCEHHRFVRRAQIAECGGNHLIHFDRFRELRHAHDHSRRSALMPTLCTFLISMLRNGVRSRTERLALPNHFKEDRLTFKLERGSLYRKHVRHATCDFAITTLRSFRNLRGVFIVPQSRPCPDWKL